MATRSRVDQRRMLLIRKEFLTIPGPERCFGVLDVILSELKFLQRFTGEQRRMIYENAVIMSVPA